MISRQLALLDRAAAAPPASPTSSAARGAALLAAQLLSPLLLGLGMAASVARHESARWSVPGLVAWLGGIAVAYGLDRMAPGRRARDRASNPRRTALLLRHARAVRGVVAAGGLAVLAGLAIDPHHVLLPVAGLAAATLAYPWLSRLPLGKTVAVAACYAVGAATLPLRGAPVAHPVVLAVGLLVLSGCLLCDLKDGACDRATGVRSLASFASPRAVALVAAASAWLGGLAGTLGGAPELGVAAALLLGLAARPQTCARELVGPAMIDLAIALPALLALFS